MKCDSNEKEIKDSEICLIFALNFSNVTSIIFSVYLSFYLFKIEIKKEFVEIKKKTKN